jgi:hypothetical protein
MLQTFEAKLIEEFDPNADKHQPFATFIPHRGPQFKAHGRRQDALSALSSNYAGVLYGHTEGQWTEITRKLWDEKVGKCDNCGGSTLSPERDTITIAGQKFHSTGYRSRGRLVPGSAPPSYDHGEFLLRRNSGRIVEPPEYIFVCPICAPRFHR